MRPHVTDTAPGWMNRRFAHLERDIREMRAEKRLRASSFADASIPSTALTNPSASGYVFQTAAGFALTTAGADVISSAVTVPASFSGCVVVLTGRVYAKNTTAASDTLYARPTVAGMTGNAYPLPVAAGAAGTNVAPFAVSLSGLTAGTTFTVTMWAQSLTAAWGATAANTADLSGSLSWF